MTAMEEIKKQKKDDDRKHLSELYEKGYGKNSKKAKRKERKIGPSRKDMMLEAKDRKIKNFRVLNRDELEEALKKDTPKSRIDEICKGAVARWKSGWGKRKPSAAPKTSEPMLPKKIGKTITTGELGKKCTEALAKTAKKEKKTCKKK